MKFLIFAFCALAFHPALASVNAKAYVKKPKLVVVLVIDQLRGELLTRLQDRLRPAGSANNPGGFRFLMENAAWFPQAEYEISQSMTCVGHAMILSGSLPAMNGISLNHWFDIETRRKVSCVEDEKDGISPRKLLTSTLGDEMKGGRPPAKVVSISIKDRSAVMLGGHRADHAIWLKDDGSAWTTSSFYGDLPTWIAPENTKIQTKKLDLLGKNVSASLEGTRSTLRLAERALTQEKMGRDEVPDLLAISLSNHDILGHAVGPEAPEMEALTLAEDIELQKFFQLLKNQVGSWDDILFVLTSDHGIPGRADKNLPAGVADIYFDSLAAIRNVNRHLDQAFGIRTKEPWILGTFLLNFYLNEKLIADQKLSRETVEKEAKKAFLREKGVVEAFTRHEFEQGKFPANLIGRQLRNTFRPEKNGHVMLVLQPYLVEKSDKTANHMTGWGYDRHVPLFIMGKSMRPGVYPGGKITDIAPTLSFLLGTTPPSMSEGQVLSEALH